jgi:hypothetical protein
MPDPVLIAWTVIGALASLFLVVVFLLACAEVLADRREKRLAELELREAERRLSDEAQVFVWSEWSTR